MMEPVEFIPRMGKLGLGAAPKPQMMPGKKRIKNPGEVEKKVLQIKIMFLKWENLMYVCETCQITDLIIMCLWPFYPHIPYFLE